MWFGKTRVSAATILAALLLVLVPSMAYLQYRWLGQLSEAESERMHRTLRTAASQFAVEFDSEISKTMVGLQMEGPTLRDRNWTNYAQRYTSWADSAANPKLVREILLVDVGRPIEISLPGFGPNGPHAATVANPDQFTLLKWDATALTFAPIDWPVDLAKLRPTLANQLNGLHVDRERGGRGGPDRFRRDAGLSSVLSDDQTLVNTVSLFEPPPNRQPGPPRISVLGFTLVRLDPDVLRGTLLPQLAARHLHGDDGSPEYRVTVVERQDHSKVIWESEPGAAATIGQTPDVSQDFMTPRSDRMLVFQSRSGDNPSDAPPVPPESIVVSVMERRQNGAGGRVVTESRAFSPFEGRWTLLATHRAGSLEAAVSEARTRNLMLSSGILLLLSATVALIVVSSRRAQELARQQMEFVAAVSHELRTPVSVIGAAAGNLADGVVGDPQRVKKYGETIRGEARRLAETVERVLQLAGIAAGRAAAATTTVHPATLVEDAIEACRVAIDDAQVEVVIDIAPQLPPVRGDVAALRSALQNLVTNAVKYGGSGKWLRVSARTPPSPIPNPQSRPASVTFTVEDRGLGIDAEDRKHIFEPFYRGREAVSRQIQGSGLGLNLVHRIAEAHGGKVTVASEPGKGSTFTLVLPAAQGTESAVGAVDTLVPHDLHARTSARS